MISRFITIHGWRVLFFFAVRNPDSLPIIRALRDAGAQTEITGRAQRLLESDRLNCGFTYSSREDKTAVTYIGPTTSAAQFLNTWSHELRHIADAVTEPGEREPPAYLTGDICEELKDIICAFSCDKCRKSL